MRNFILISLMMATPFCAKTQVNEHETGAWYMYFWNAKFKNSGFGAQGDVQLRKWNIFGDLEQLLIRGGLTYRPKNADILFTLGYGDVTSGTYGESNSTSRESRIYQEVLMPHKVNGRFHFRHRIRFEQRFVDNQSFRTRYRYALFLNLPFNNEKIRKGTFYFALYDELFINGQRDVGNGNSVEIFDRNRLYAGLGYSLMDGLALQLGYMQQTTDSWNKGQIQLSLHHNIEFGKADTDQD